MTCPTCGKAMGCLEGIGKGFPAADEIDKLNREKTILMKVSGVTQEELDEAIASLVCVRRREDDKAL